MGLRLKIEGSESVNLPETSIERVKFGADIPNAISTRYLKCSYIYSQPPDFSPAFLVS